MAEEISKEDFFHLVELAALELNPDESELLRRQLNNQLKSISELVAIPLDEETPTASHGVPYDSSVTPPLRPDDWLPHTNPEKLMDCAPEIEHGFIVVPETPHEQL